jgi:hypothetical protein
MPADLAPIRARIETDLSDPALQSLLAAAREAVDERLGPVGPVSERRSPSGPLIRLSRRAVEILAVDEHRVALEPADWLLRSSGRILERVGRRRWYGLVDVTYQPLPDTARREQASIALVKLEIRHDPGIASAKFGSWAESYTTQGGLSYEEEREAILCSLVDDTGGIW